MSAGIATDAGMSFGTAVEMLKRGHLMARRGWNGRGMWIRRVDLYNDPDFSVRENGTARGTWLPFIAMKTVDNGLVPWLASQTDVLAHDWIEVES